MTDFFDLKRRKKLEEMTQNDLDHVQHIIASVHRLMPAVFAGFTSAYGGIMTYEQCLDRAFMNPMQETEIDE